MLPYWIAIAVLAIVILASFRRVTVLEFERGLRYRSGRFAGVLEPGSCWVLRWLTHITTVDVRPTLLTVPAQEVVAADGVGLKITVAAMYRIASPQHAVHEISDFRDGLYTILQLGLRELVAARPAETILAERSDIGERLLASAAGKVAAFGLELTSAEIKDVMFPGDLKKVFSQVVRARQEGLAALERARGETAALRNLANAASMLEQRPVLLQLRLLQAIGAEGGNTVVVGLGNHPTIIPAKSESGRHDESQ
jgi:regulator of protease activity HflC (stomatin/prohibitin superfamily)